MSIISKIKARYRITADDHEPNADEIQKGYLEAMLWSSSDMDNENEHLDKKYGVDDISDELEASSKKDIEAFLKKVKEAGIDLSKYDDDRIGHDFWLTRAGHGAGFWDGDYEADEEKKDGDKLTEITKSFGNLDPYAGDDGKIYV